MTVGPLSGFTIGVTADRRADEQMKLLAGRGAHCLHGPVIKTHALGSEDQLRLATEMMLDDPPVLVVLTTGLGVRGWLEAAEVLQLGDELRELLASVDLYARGPKATGALTTAGLDVEWTAPNARYDDIIDELDERGIDGDRIAVQLDGAGAGELCDRFEKMGADVVRVPVYRWSMPGDTSPAERLIRATIERRVDALTFTAKPAVDNFLEIAEFLGVGDELAEALASHVATFCVGPVCATGLTDGDIATPFVPDKHRLGAMVQQIARHFAVLGDDVRLGGATIRLQGRLVAFEDGVQALLTERERAILDVLLERPGVVRSKHELLRLVWHGSESDEHLVEVTVARLRQRLGPAAQGIETVIRRGYRASAD
ncbi:MAG: uroporphyrinogen-III synthase [Ilumatobacter sp.]|uniref:uroporphyrinogen-III synthase n=1 Tax=Ilumatobacter sp. TaxID=1967498 RepID=UPI003C76A0EE